ncbi:slr1931 [Synechocystis sp. PCC 6803]|uniref:Slr1931 protein n=2 Tax=unclassified Synechocystis TaxID=2640012 RepID=P74483_SYNY3|nr:MULTISPECIES: hypothetical protein [unclassified Synechocystis]MBD2620074.1 hypothetical protein [Synechocystis sp. FACHB-898]MBD2640605.1 hypothetical protein [Synechocystis sp. FACHB-908]MBD2662756.1 hypothetical protein [Synechocystis sp. FACHB-929]BAM54684.1 hypothetical protein BEST7613_5753 [Synechocystis sp. PCC 6803] [Bacillus subtilis BEST7613]AGF52272.1 hypothetical protein MYO_120310 [Synechocystis sp. PCC 6803]
MKILWYLMTRNSSKGFTLLELLLASIMTFFVVSATGYAILVMTRENISSDVSSDLRFNTDRATDFIADEIRQANFLSTNTANIPTNTGTGIESCAMQTGEQFVMGLAVSSSDVNVVYYTKTPPGGVWLGPSSIYRCGPSLTSSGQLGSGRIRSILVDSISTAAGATTPTCPSGTTKRPTTPTAGFFLCVDNSNQNLVQLRLTAASDELANRGMTTTGGQGRFDSKATYSVVTTAFTRAASDIATLNESGTCTGVTVAVDGRAAIPFSSGMSVVATSSSTMVFSPGTWTKTGNSYTSGGCTINAVF